MYFYILSLLLYFCSCFCDCRQCLLSWEVQTWQMAPCHNRWDSVVLLKLVSLRFMHSTLRSQRVIVQNVKDIHRHFAINLKPLLGCFYDHVVKFAKRRIRTETQFLLCEKCCEKSDYQSNAW